MWRTELLLARSFPYILKSLDPTMKVPEKLGDLKNCKEISKRHGYVYMIPVEQKNQQKSLKFTKRHYNPLSLKMFGKLNFSKMKFKL